MANVNINRNLSDQFYRYKMPKLLAKVEGKGNGIKTVIVNMVEVAKALNRPPMYPTKYFGCVLGAQVNGDVKTERYIVNGSHEASKLQDLLDGFIQKYVLCPSCENPETDLTVSQRKGTITTKCKACGYLGNLNTKEKLTVYILKNPPNAPVTTGASVCSAKKSKRKMKEEMKKQTNGDNNGDHSPQGDSDELNEQDNDNEMNGDNEDDEDWCEDTDADAVAKRMEELSLGAKVLTLNTDLEKTQEERFEMFFEYSKQKIDGPMDINVQKEIVAEAERLDIRDKAVIVLCELLFADSNKIIQQIKTHRNLFLRFTADNPKAQKYLLRGFELTIKENQEQLMPRVAHILKALYDADILDEDVLIDWGSKAQKKTVGKECGQKIYENASPFIKWLKEADEEGSSSDNEEEEIEVVYDDRIRGDKVIEELKQEHYQPKVEAEKPKSKQTEGEEIDIDAI